MLAARLRGLNLKGFVIQGIKMSTDSTVQKSCVLAHNLSWFCLDTALPQASCRVIDQTVLVVSLPSPRCRFTTGQSMIRSTTSMVLCVEAFAAPSHMVLCALWMLWRPASSWTLSNIRVVCWVLAGKSWQKKVLLCWPPAWDRPPQATLSRAGSSSVAMSFSRSTSPSLWVIRRLGTWRHLSCLVLLLARSSSRISSCAPWKQPEFVRCLTQPFPRAPLPPWRSWSPERGSWAGTLALFQFCSSRSPTPWQSLQFREAQRFPFTVPCRPKERTWAALPRWVFLSLLASLREWLQPSFHTLQTHCFQRSTRRVQEEMVECSRAWQTLPKRLALWSFAPLVLDQGASWLAPWQQDSSWFLTVWCRSWELRSSISTILPSLIEQWWCQVERNSSQPFRSAQRASASLGNDLGLK